MRMLAAPTCDHDPTIAIWRMTRRMTTESVPCAAFLPARGQWDRACTSRQHVPVTRPVMQPSILRSPRHLSLARQYHIFGVYSVHPLPLVCSHSSSACGPVHEQGRRLVQAADPPLGNPLSRARIRIQSPGHACRITRSRLQVPDMHCSGHDVAFIVLVACAPGQDLWP